MISSQRLLNGGREVSHTELDAADSDYPGICHLVAPSHNGLMGGRSIFDRPRKDAGRLGPMPIDRMA
jgi:hypothetical protein